MENIIALADKTIILKRNELIPTFGRIDTNIYYIEKGTIKIFIDNNETEQIVRFGYNGNLVVALDSFMNFKPSVFYIQAIKETTIKVITKKQLEDYIKATPDHLQQWITILENLVVQQLDREIDLLTESPSERYERVLKRSPQLFQEIPHKHIANYLRMSPETLSRLKKC